jgi:hypothetical protein
MLLTGLNRDETLPILSKLLADAPDTDRELLVALVSELAGEARSNNTRRTCAIPDTEPFFSSYEGSATRNVPLLRNRHWSEPR